jgi:hypothetical protein
MSSGAISTGFSPTFNKIQTGDATKLQASSAKAKSVDDQFKQYADMTPAQRMRANILASMGLKESDLAAMDPKQRQAVEDQIAKQLKQAAEKQIDKKSGFYTDMKV